jgi:hypothetical protein
MECEFCGADKTKIGTCDHSASCPIVVMQNCSHDEWESWEVKEDPRCKKCGILVSELAT